MANGLHVAVRRKRIDQAYRDQVIFTLTTLGIRFDPRSETRCWSVTLPLAAQYGLSVYDAAYLELAQRLRLPLATLDAALARAAQQAGVEVLPG